MKKISLESVAKPVRASIWFTVCNIIQKGIHTITVPLFTRLLSTEEYGQFSLYQSWVNIIWIFATLNLSSGVFNNGMTKYENDRDGYTSTMQGLTTVTVSFMFFVYLAAADQWDRLFGLPRVVMYGIFLDLLLEPALLFWSSRQRYEYRYRALVAVTLGIAVLNPAVGLIAVYLASDRGLARILSAICVNVFVGGVFFVRNFCKGRRFFQKEQWLFALRFNLPLIPHYLSQIVLAQADRIMIGKMFGKSQVAIYSIAYTIGLAMNFVTNGINSSFIPWTYQMCKAKKYSRIGKMAIIILTMVAVISIVPILAAPEIIAIMGPKEYAEAVWVIPPVAVSGYFMMVYSVFCNIEFYYAENRFVMVGSIIAAVGNIILNYICMELFGYMAAGYTTLLCYIILAAAHYIFMRKVLRKHEVRERIYQLRPIIVLTVVLVAAAAASMLLYKLPVIRYSLLLVGACVAGVYRKQIVRYLKSIRNGNAASEEND